MTSTALKSRPRDTIRVYAIGGERVADQMLQLAKLRLDHPGGVPIMEPQAWSAAYAGTKMVAAIGYFMVQENHLIVTEVDRTPDHGGRVACFCAVCAVHGCRQAKRYSHPKRW